VILALDTSTEQASIALLREGAPLAELSWLSQRNHSRQLSSAIRFTLQLANADASQLGALVVAIGPGSFNGVRVGVSAAKGLALGLRVPLVGVSTLDVIAYQHSDTGKDVLAVVPAGRGQVYMARYHGQGSDWRRASEYSIAGYAEAAREVEDSTLIVGPGASAVLSEFAASAGAAAAPVGASAFRRAAYLAELGKQYLDAGGEDQLTHLEPLYLRRPAAEEKRGSSESSP
jgi:tRNA threonylcarbamoyladenosine biosynthesis protein TsaB